MFTTLWFSEEVQKRNPVNSLAHSYLKRFMVLFSASASVITVTQKTQVALKLTHEEWNLAQVFQRKWTVSKVLHAAPVYIPFITRASAKNYGTKKLHLRYGEGNDKRGNNCRVLSHAENTVAIFFVLNKNQANARDLPCEFAGFSSNSDGKKKCAYTHKWE